MSVLNVKFSPNNFKAVADVKTFKVDAGTKPLFGSEANTTIPVLASKTVKEKLACFKLI